MTIKADGTSHTVNLPTGDVSTDNIKATIEAAIPPRTEYIKNQFTTVTDIGESNSRHFNSTAYGTTKTTSWSDSATGSFQPLEGGL